MIRRGAPRSPLKFAKLIGGDIHVVSDGGHFNSATGYDEFEELYSNKK